MAKLTREMLSLNDPNLLKTVPFNGIPLVHHAISEHLARCRGMDVDPDQIIVGSGIEYLYSRLMQLDRLAQSGVSLMRVSPANSFPLGSVMPIRRRLDLLSWLDQDNSRYLIEDDFDSELNSYGNPATPIFGADPGERTIYLNSFSKTLVPSLRISYMVLPPALIERYLATMTFYSYTVSGSDQYVLARFVQDGYFEPLERLREGLLRLKDCIAPESGSSAHI